MKKDLSKTVANKEALQSYILTTSKYDFNVYEKRILYYLVELAQKEIEGLHFKNNCCLIEHELFDIVNISMPISYVLVGDDDKNYSRVKKAVTSLSQKYVIYDDGHIWMKLNIVAFPLIDSYKSNVEFKIHTKIWDVILDFTKGYRKFELQTALMFKSVYSMRLYELISRQTKPLTYTIEYLRDIFQVQNKYKNVNDFIRYVVVPAQTELNEKSPYSFDYKINKQGRKFHSITFYPRYIQKNRDENLETKELHKKMALSWIIDRNTKDYLQTNFGYTSAELKQNIDVLERASKLFSIIDFCAKIKPKALRANNPKGYVINALKKEIEQQKK